MSFRKMQMTKLEQAYKDMHNAAVDSFRATVELTQNRVTAASTAEYAAIMMVFKTKSDRVDELIKLIKELDESENKD